MDDPVPPIVAQLREISEACRAAANDLGGDPFDRANEQDATQAAELDDCRLEPIAAGILKLRRERERLFGAVLFADPAWDMLLDLFVHQLRGRKVSVSSLCIAAYVPATTALRYMAVLEAKGFVTSSRAIDDCRKRYVELTPAASDKLRRLLRKADAPAQPL